MTVSLKPSLWRLILGGCFALVSLLGALYLLPDASKELAQQRQAEANAMRQLESQETALKELTRKKELIDKGLERLSTLEANMPKGSLGALQWTLSQALHELGKTHAVRVQSIKYGLPGREGAKGTDIENIDVEFTAVAVYGQLKKFMLGLEESGLPFGVTSVKLDEGPEGARLTVVLRAFRRTTTPQVERVKEEA